MSLRSPKGLFQAHIIHYRGPMGFVMREAEEVLSLWKSREHGKELQIPYLFDHFCSFFFGQDVLFFKRGVGRKNVTLLSFVGP